MGRGGAICVRGGTISGKGRGQGDHWLEVRQMESSLERQQLSAAEPGSGTNSFSCSHRFIVWEQSDNY